MNELNQNTEFARPKFGLFGASGAIGKSVARALSDRGIAYRVVGRNLDKLKSTFGADPLAELVTWNPDHADSVKSAAAGTDTLIYMVGVPYNQFERHPIIMQQTLDGAIAAGVKRIVMIASVYPYGSPQTAKVDESHPRNPTTVKGIIRKKQEDILLDAHKAGKIQATVLRLPDFYGFDAGPLSFLHLAFKAAVLGGAADLIGPIDLPHEFVYVPDVGPVVLDLASKPEAYGHWWNFAGSGVTTQRELVNSIFALAGRRPSIRVVGKTGLKIIGLFNPIMRELAEMHYLITSPVLLDDMALTKLIGPMHKTSYSDGIKLAYYAYASVDKTALKNDALWQ